jgi:hypothetical protein
MTKHLVRYQQTGHLHFVTFSSPARRPFWQKRYYDFNVYCERKRTEKLTYMHRNPVARGLVQEPGEWARSSYRQYASHG